MIRGARGLFTTSLLASVLLPALLVQPHAYGDAGEYLLMVESLYRHGSPELRSEDLASLSADRTTGRIEGPFSQGVLSQAYRQQASGRAYSIHFWAYSLLCLPAKAVLRGLGANDLRAPQITNALLFLIALLRAGPYSSLHASSRWAFATLLLLSPAWGFVFWPHPEIFSCSLVALSLVFWREERRPFAVLLAALASVQNAPLALYAGWLCWKSCREALAKPRHGVSALRAVTLPVAALLPAFWPFAFYLFHYGRPTLMVEVGAVDLQQLSLGRAWDLLFDLNLGLLPYVPLPLLGALGAPLAQRRTAGAGFSAWELGALLVAMAIACGTTVNWNHGTSGPSRYAIWLLPFVLEIFTRMLEPDVASTPVRSTYLGLAALAVVVQVGICAYRGTDVAPDHLRHSYAASAVLRRAPAFYNPCLEVFAERTLGREIEGEQILAGAPVVYSRDGRCRKALTQKRLWPHLLELCGQPRVAPDFRALARTNRRDRWIYVNY